MAAIWTDLFESMLVDGCNLRWAGRGPGVGRDARIAYSGLLGRYMARAYLTSQEGVRVLVPLELAKCCFEGTRYSIEKDPPGRGLLADWIGLDWRGLVIAEAKGTYDGGHKTWKGPLSRPSVLDTAIAQAGRTAAYVSSSGSRRKLPATRWAVASRWGTASKTNIEPTLIAWDPGESSLSESDYFEISAILLRAHVAGVVNGLGHLDSALTISAGKMPTEMDDIENPAELGFDIEPGLAAVAGPFGVRPMRDRGDIELVNAARDLGIPVAVASMSARYLENVISDVGWAVGQAGRRNDVFHAEERFASQGGLTVRWL